jgi:hypothetical protein
VSNALIEGGTVQYDGVDALGTDSHQATKKKNYIQKENLLIGFIIIYFCLFSAVKLHFLILSF